MAGIAAVTVKPLRRDAAENRERLLAAAGRVFAAHGLDAGVEEVAREAGVGMGTLYRRFPSKQALIDELVGGLRADLLTTAYAATACTDGTGLETLLFAAGQLQAGRSGCLRQLWEQSDANLDAIAEFRACVIRLLKDAQEHGRIRADVTGTDISLMLWSVGGVIEKAGSVAPRAWRRHLELLLAGLRPVPSGPFATELTEGALTPAQVSEISASRN